MNLTLPDLDPVQIVTAVATFGFVLATWMFILILWLRIKSARQERLKMRLDPHSGETLEARTLRLWHEGAEYTTTIHSARFSSSAVARLRSMRLDAGYRAPLANLLMGLVAGSLAAAAGIFVLTGRVLPALFAVGIVLLAAVWTTNVRIARRRSIFERQLVDALELGARALLAGHPLLGSFQLIAEEIPAPVGTLFGQICKQHEMGLHLEDCLRRASEDSRSPDMRLFSASMAINIKTGGNLAEVVHGLARVIRERMRLNRRFRVLTSQTQYSKRILIAMPFIMFFVLNILNAEYMAPLYTTRNGNMILLAAFGMLSAGWWMMNKMAALKT